MVVGKNMDVRVIGGIVSHCGIVLQSQGTKTRKSHEMQHELHIRLKQPKDRSLCRGRELRRGAPDKNSSGSRGEGEAKDMHRGLVGYKLDTEQ